LCRIDDYHAVKIELYPLDAARGALGAAAGATRMFTSELEYFRQRAREERERAATAPNPIVAEVHRALAEKYEALMRQPDLRVALSQLWRSRESSPAELTSNEGGPAAILRDKPPQIPPAGATLENVRLLATDQLFSRGPG
jgi:hypothetical protein